MAQFDEAVIRLREGILAGAYVPGDKLGAAEVAAQLGMSRTPVREAFRILSMEGLVELTANRGARVRAWPHEELDAVFETRLRLEGFACRRAAERVTLADVDKLQSLAEQIVAAGRQESVELVQQLNSTFHNTILSLADSNTITTAMSGVIHAAVLNRTRQSYDAESQRRSDGHHFEIVAALRAGDGQWAESTMHSHLLSARASLMGPRRRLEP